MNNPKSAPSSLLKEKTVKIALKYDDGPHHAVRWNRRERIEWTIILFVGTTILFSARTILPLCAVAIAKEFGWDKAETGFVLACFLWGYPCTQIPGGYISDKIGGDLVLYHAAVVWGAVTIVTPRLPYIYSSKAATIFAMASIRFLLGITQGVHYPSMSSFISKKVSIEDKPAVVSMIFAASSAGTLFTGAVGSVMLLYYDWHAVFYFVGLLSIAWGVLVRCYVRKHRHKLIYMLHNGKKGDGMRKGREVDTDGRTPQGCSHFPWKQLITKKPFWAVVFGHSCTNFLFFIMISWMPTYFTEVYPGHQGWVFNVLPWLVSIPSSLCSGFVATMLLSWGCSVVNCRKSIHTIACIGMSVSLIAVCFATEYNTALFLMITAVASQAFSNAGVQVSIQDIAPKHAGAVYGMTNCCGAIAGFLGTYLTGYILHLWYSWPAVFSMAVVVLLFGWSIFVNFASSNPVI